MKSEELEIRDAKPEDSPAIIAFLKDLVQEDGISVPMYVDEIVTAKENADHIQRQCHEKGDRIILALHGDAVVGMIDTRSNPRRANSHDVSFGLLIGKEFRSQGLGKKLLTMILDWLKTLPNIWSINLTVWKSNEKARRLYESVGFEVWGERKYSTYKYGEFQPILHMELLLKEFEDSRQLPNIQS